MPDTTPTAGRTDGATSVDTDSEIAGSSPHRLELYSSNQIRTAAALGTWIAGYLLVADNYRVVGDYGECLKSLGAALVATVVVFGGGPVISGIVGGVADQAGFLSEYASGWLVPVLLSGPAILWIGLGFAVAAAAEKFETRLAETEDPGGLGEETRSNGRVAAICIASLTAVGLALWGLFSWYGSFFPG